jgi:DNA-binding NarL/FixJ family response regulator
MKPPLPRVIIADDHVLVAEGVRRLLQNDFDVIDCVTDGLALIEAVERDEPDLIVTDVAMPKLGGLAAIRTLGQKGYHVRSIVLTMHADPLLAAVAFSAGASGFVLKHAASEELILAINATLAGGTYVTSQFSEAAATRLHEQVPTVHKPAVQLTPRQQEVLELLLEGAPVKQIATRLKISRRTVEAHKYQLMRALGVRSIAELVQHAIRRGLLPVDTSEF